MRAGVRAERLQVPPMEVEGPNCMHVAGIQREAKKRASAPRLFGSLQSVLALAHVWRCSVFVELNVDMDAWAPVYSKLAVVLMQAGFTGYDCTIMIGRPSPRASRRLANQGHARPGMERLSLTLLRLWPRRPPSASWQDSARPCDQDNVRIVGAIDSRSASRLTAGKWLAEARLDGERLEKKTRSSDVQSPRVRKAGREAGSGSKGSHGRGGCEERVNDEANVR